MTEQQIKPDAGNFMHVARVSTVSADMLLIREAVFLMKHLLNLDDRQIRDVFIGWDEQEPGYPTEFIAALFHRNGMLDPSSGASNAAHSEWAEAEKRAVHSALDNDVSLPAIGASVFFQMISEQKEERLRAGRKLNGPELNPFDGHRDRYLENIRQALYLARVVLYTQMSDLIQSASASDKRISARDGMIDVFQDSGMISEHLLKRITDALIRNGHEPAGLLLDPYFAGIAETYQISLRRVVSIAVTDGLPVPSFSAAIAYYDCCRRTDLPDRFQIGETSL